MKQVDFNILELYKNNLSTAVPNLKILIYDRINKGIFYHNINLDLIDVFKKVILKSEIILKHKSANHFEDFNIFKRYPILHPLTGIGLGSLYKFDDTNPLEWNISNTGTIYSEPQNFKFVYYMDKIEQEYFELVILNLDTMDEVFIKKFKFIDQAKKFAIQHYIKELYLKN